ncbi:MAG: exo-alpha-sialidase [Pirellulales bacterium]
MATAWAGDATAGSTVGYEISRHVPTRLFDGERCWCHPRAGIVTAAGADGGPRVVMTMNTMHLSGSDVFKGMYSLETNDLGEHWTEPQLSDALAPRYEEIDGVRRPVAVSDFWPKWHAASGQLLGTGHTVVYTPDWRVTHPRPRHTSYAVYNPSDSHWNQWRKLEMPADEPFADSGAGCAQRVDLADGSILLPFYFRPPEKNSRVAVMRCTFDGQTLRYQEHGNVLTHENETRGLHEPSLAHFGGEFLLTIRNDKLGFVTRSRDGLEFEPIQEWRFDDDEPLGSYNTQQHWVTHTDGLFLVYTRRGANNDHVFRHRAPLFMAQVDPARLRVVRSTERVLVPERGARLGNFGVTRVSPQETWVTVSEWMQPRGVEKYGSDGSVYVARIRWDRPNV